MSVEQLLYMGIRTPGTESLKPVQGTVRVMAFWGVVLLPVTYLPLLYTMDGSRAIAVLTLVILVNTCCLLAHQKLR